jgi:ubiquinone/menaquinone biosynthesis C-methylase UbiE
MKFMDIYKMCNSQTCPWWLIFTFDNLFRQRFHDPQKILGGYVQPGDTVLDVGCGMGYFSLGMVELVGENGKVIAVDLQEEMLRGLRRRAKRLGLDGRIECHLSSPQAIGVDGPVNFVLAFWMVHEVRQPQRFLNEIYQLLKPGGKFLLVEPIVHVTGRDFQLTTELSISTGFQIVDKPRVFASRTILLQK